MISHYSFHVPSASTQTTSLFTHSSIYSISIYWTTGQGTEDTDTKSSISDLQQHTGLPFCTSRLLTFLSPSPGMLFSSIPHLHLPEFHPGLNASFPLIQIPPSSWSLIPSTSFSKLEEINSSSQKIWRVTCILRGPCLIFHWTLYVPERRSCVSFHLCIWKNIRYNAAQVLITQLNLVEWTSLLEMHHVNEVSLSLRF